VLSFNSTFNSTANTTYTLVSETFNNIVFDHYVTLKMDSSTTEIQRIYGTSSSRYNTELYSTYHEGKAFDTLFSLTDTENERRLNSVSYVGDIANICFYYEVSFVCTKIDFTQWNNTNNNVDNLKIYISGNTSSWNLVVNSAPNSSGTTSYTITDNVSTNYVLFEFTGSGTDIGYSEILIYGKPILTALSTFIFNDNFSVYNFYDVNNIVLNVNTENNFTPLDTLFVVYKGLISNIDPCAIDQYTSYTIIGKQQYVSNFINLTIYGINTIAINGVLELSNIMFLINPNNSNKLYVAEIDQTYNLNKQIIENGGFDIEIENNFIDNEQFYINKTQFAKFEFSQIGKNYIVGKIVASTNNLVKRKTYNVFGDLAFTFILDYDYNDEIIQIQFTDIFNLPPAIVYTSITVSQNNSYIQFQQPEANLMTNNGVFIYLQNNISNYILHFDLSNNVNIFEVYDNLFEIISLYSYNVNYDYTLSYELHSFTTYNNNSATSIFIPQYFAYCTNIKIDIDISSTTSFDIYNVENNIVQSYNFDSSILLPHFTYTSNNGYYFKIVSLSEFALHSILFEVHRSIDNYYTPSPTPIPQVNPEELYDVTKVFISSDINPFTSTQIPVYTNNSLVFDNSYIFYTFVENINQYEIYFTFKLQEIKDYHALICVITDFHLPTSASKLIHTMEN
jgi:hypothetical protein